MLAIAVTSGLDVDYEAVVSFASTLSRLLELPPDTDRWAVGGRDGSSQDGSATCSGELPTAASQG